MSIVPAGSIGTPARRPRPPLELVRRPRSEREASFLSTRLDLDWQRLCRQTEPNRIVISWDLLATDDPPLAGLADLLRRLGFRERLNASSSPSTPAPTPRVTAGASGASGEVLLAKVLERASTDPLAARVVLQRILPGLVGIARAERDRYDNPAAFDDLLAEAWWVITKFDLQGRTDHLAARLLSSARHRAFIRPRRWVHRERYVPPHVLDDTIDDAHLSAIDEVISVVGEARRRGLADEHLESVRGLLRTESINELAAELKLEPRTVRYRRERCATQVRSLTGDDAA